MAIKPESEIKYSEELIQKMEAARGSKIISYVLGDRAISFPMINMPQVQMAEDAIRPMYDHLLKLGKQEKIDLFIYSRGGDVSVPWRIVSMFREFCEEFSVIVPYRAHSAATLVSIGADKIIMGKKGELGPIDPLLTRVENGKPTMVAAEDVNSYLSLVKEKANLNDQQAVSQMMSILAQQVSPVFLGTIYRTNSHIRLVARKLLSSRKEKVDENKLNSLINTLTEQIYFHGHGIGRREARDIGLPVVNAEEIDAGFEQDIWNLFINYEEYLNLQDPIDLHDDFQAKDEAILRNQPLGIIESSTQRHEYKTSMKFKQIKSIPSNLQINVSLNLQAPQFPSPEQQPTPAQQNMMQTLLRQIQSIIPQIVRDEVVRQSPVAGYTIELFSGKWSKVK
ncbi:MAG: hypothetical protein JRN10_02165 [Nitrososphaerota archaeon]|nr:hypothetical protein [Nitrososphaerota archaeon]